jgi:hypothetical protein
MDDAKLIDTATVAKRFRQSATTLGSYLSRHPHLRPARRVGTAYLWTEEEIERLWAFKLRPVSTRKKGAED